LSLGFDHNSNAEAYAHAALDRECELVASTGHGRNDQINVSAFSLGQLVAGGLLDRSDVERRVYTAAEASGYVGKDGPAATRATIASGISKGMREPRAAPVTSNSAPIQVRRPAPILKGVALPDWTPPGEDGKPTFFAIGVTEPKVLTGEIRRHTYRRDGEVIRVKVKIAEGGFRDFYRVRRPADGANGWQARKPEGYAPMPYLGPVDAFNPFDPEMVGETVFWPEGEKDVDTLQRAGLCAFTFGGASDLPDCADLLRDRDVVVLGDNDEPGEKCVGRKVELIRLAAARVRTVRFRDLAEHGDVSDWLAAGGAVEALVERAEDIPALWEVPAGGGAPKFVLEPLRAIRPVLKGSWLVKGLLPSHGLAVVYGPPSCGKSFVTLDVALHVAAGLSYGNRLTKQVGVVYIAAEGGSGFRKRVWAAKRHLKINDDLPFALVTTAPNLGLVEGDAAALIDCIVNQSTALGFVPGLIIVDTLARSIAGADENSSKDIGIFVANAERIGVATHSLVIAVHHSGKDVERGMRGSSALHGAADAEWEVGSDDAGKRVRVAKMKEGEDNLSWRFRLRKVEVGADEDGDPVTSLIVEVLEEAQHFATSKRNDRAALKGQKAEFMKGVRMALDDFGEMPPTSNKIPPRVKCVSRKNLMRLAESLGFLEGKTENVKRAVLSRLISTLCGDGHLGQWGDWIWTP